MTISVQCDSSPLLDSIADAKRLLKSIKTAVNVGDFAQEIIDSLIGLSKSGEQLVSIEQLPTARTGEVRLRLDAGNRLSELVSALRARHSELGIVE